MLPFVATPLRGEGAMNEASVQIAYADLILLNKVRSDTSVLDHVCVCVCVCVP